MKIERYMSFWMGTWAFEAPVDRLRVKNFSNFQYLVLDIDSPQYLQCLLSYLYVERHLSDGETVGSWP